MKLNLWAFGFFFSPQTDPCLRLILVIYSWLTHYVQTHYKLSQLRHCAIEVSVCYISSNADFSVASPILGSSEDLSLLNTQGCGTACESVCTAVLIDAYRVAEVQL